jgi:glycosyltransferase involved in cell wall biosynthesis
MATLEAMAAGLPVLGNCHPHGKSGFLSDDPQALRAYAQRLLADRDLAQHMGQEARRTVAERFSPDTFKRAMLQSIETARQKQQQHIQTLPHLCPIPITLEPAV